MQQSPRTERPNWMAPGSWWERPDRKYQARTVRRRRRQQDHMLKRDAGDPDATE